MSKFSMETCPLMSYEFVVQRKEGHILSYHVLKTNIFKETFDILKLRFQSGLNKKKTTIFVGFFGTNGSMGAEPKQKFANVITVSKPCNQYGDFGT